VLVPYCLGAVIGGVASGRVPSGGVAGDPWGSWVNPTSIVAGLLAVCLCAYLAGFFLVDVESYTQVRGLPFKAAELASVIQEAASNE